MGVQTKLTAIADAIREKTGGTEKLGLDAMAAAVPVVHDAGVKSEREAFWDAMTNGGTRTNYNYGFYGTGWTDENFRPTRDIVIGSANSTFRACNITDMAGILKACGVTLDFSGCTVFTSTFYGADITALPVIDASKCSTLTSVFASMASLRSIEKLILKADGSTAFTGIFNESRVLEEIRIEGTIGKNGFNVSVCNAMSHDSLMSILNALKDYSASGSTYTVTLGTTNLAKLTDTEKKIATEKGWTLA